MTAQAETLHLISSFLAARQDISADATPWMDEGFRFESPMMTFDDRHAYLLSHRSFQRLVTRMTMISELYGPDEAVLVYDLETTTPAGVQRTAEHFKVVRGKVAKIILIFDSAPWRPIFEHLRASATT